MQLKKTSFLWGLLVFAVILVVFIFAATPIQMKLGMWGVAITEILFLIISIGAALLLKFPLREAFPIRVPKARQVIGTLLMAGSGILLVTAANLIVFVLFPEGMNVAAGMTNLFQSVPGPLSWLIIALMPAICEEALHRGIILHTFKGLQNKWVIIFSMAIIFGIFHLDPYRFIGTAILGGFLTYIALETDNLLLPMLYHLGNNTISVLSSVNASSQAVEEATELIASTGNTMMLVSFGVYLFLSAGALLIFRGGALLVKAKPSPEETVEEQVLRKKKLIRSWVITAVAGFVLLVSGIVVMALNIGALITEFGA
jgi:membrane protease YdiL (CAAX protease family)